VTDSLDDRDDELFFEVGAALRSRDERIARGLERIARGDDAAEVEHTLGALEEHSAREFAEMREFAEPLGEDFVSSLGDLALRESQAAPAVSVDAPAQIVSLATWRTRSWRAGGGALAVAASLTLLFMAGEDEDAWNEQYSLELVNAPEVTRGVAVDGTVPSNGSLSLVSSGLAEWVLRPNEVVTVDSAFGAFLRDSRRGSVVHVGEPCIKHQVSSSGAVHVELNLPDCSWAGAGVSYDLQFVVGPPASIERKRNGKPGVDGMSAVSVALIVTDG
jgi:hypothetical protein